MKEGRRNYKSKNVSPSVDLTMRLDCCNLDVHFVVMAAEMMVTILIHQIGEKVCKAQSLVDPQ